uniref:histone acetyltransferase n=1 Tax=Micrurus spixii TaxID=129469 RepID=A0A2D4LFS2_9SAUR
MAASNSGENCYLTVMSCLCETHRYVTGHIWACPPSEGDDYIFHCHPPDQKIPKPKRLQEWYKKMLDKAFAERIIHDYKDIFKQATEDRLTSAKELPYFEGDFWPNVLEESIKELEQEEEERKKEESTAASETIEVTKLMGDVATLCELCEPQILSIQHN